MLQHVHPCGRGDGIPNGFRGLDKAHRDTLCTRHNADLAIESDAEIEVWVKQVAVFVRQARRVVQAVDRVPVRTHRIDRHGCSTALCFCDRRSRLDLGQEGDEAVEVLLGVPIFTLALVATASRLLGHRFGFTAP